MIPSPFPVFSVATKNLIDGNMISACRFCKKAVLNKPECLAHYEKLSHSPTGYYQCPFGFTSRSFFFTGKMWIITGIVAFPRFDTANEREMAKRFPEIRVSRSGIDDIVKYFASLDILRADVIAKAAKVFPQAFHELRKLNGAILQHAEKEIRIHGETPVLQTIKSAAELMRNNFDILEALSNIEGMRAIPADSTISVMDLFYKTKRVYLERANAKGIQVVLFGPKAIIRGSQKSFPIVPAVLIENAIKYGKPNSHITVNITTTAQNVAITVENESAYPMDEKKCFDRGSRFASDAAEGGGFGLFLAKEIVLAHKGQITCHTNGKHVRMLVELPLEKIAQ